MSPEEFLKLGVSYITKSGIRTSKNICIRRFKCFYGVSPKVCFIVWNLLDENLPPHSMPKHLLWCLCFLKQYSVESVRHALFNTDEKTIRKWTWTFIKLLSDLNVVNEEYYTHTILHIIKC